MSADVMLAAVGTAAAVAVAAWPKARSLMGAIKWPSVASPKASRVSFQDAIAALSAVRSRVVATGHAGADGVGRAVEVLTLALVEGSDQ